MLSSVIVNYFLALIIDSLNHNIRHSTIRRMVLVFDIFLILDCYGILSIYQHFLRVLIGCWKDMDLPKSFLKI